MQLTIAVIVLVLVSISLQLRLFEMIKTVAEYISAMTDRIAALETVEAGIKTLLSTQSAQLVAIRAELANGGVSPEQLASLDSFLTTLDTDNAGLTAAAVAAGTVAAGEPQPQPPPPAEPVVIDTTGLSPGTVGVSYSATVGISGGTGPYGLVASPPTDNGLTVNEDATITGTPVEARDVSFTLTATDSLGATANASATISIAAAAGAE